MTASKVVVVTGGAQGLGEAICRRMAARGWIVAVADINARKAAEVAGDCARTDPAAIPVAVDLATAEGPAKMVAQTVAAAGRIDARAHTRFPRSGIIPLHPLPW